MALLSVTDLRVRIAGSHILQGITFDVPSDGVTVLLGRNGVGKTTTLKAILGLTPAGAQVEGDVTLDGVRVTGTPTYQLVRRGLGYVPEDRGVFAGLTVAENLRLAERSSVGSGRAGSGRAERGGDAPDYDAVFALFPELSKRSRQKAGTLSGGQQQMLALGRVLLNRNRLLLVDEPTKGLAPKLVAEVADVLARVAGSVPILLVEQNLAVVRRLGRDAVVLAAGKVGYAGTLAGLLDDAELTRSLLGVGQRHGKQRHGEQRHGDGQRAQQDREEATVE